MVIRIRLGSTNDLGRKSCSASVIIQKSSGYSVDQNQSFFDAPRQADMSRPIFDERAIDIIKGMMQGHPKPQIIVDRQGQRFVEEANFFQDPAPY
jgi:hypothetical protein